MDFSSFSYFGLSSPPFHVFGATVWLWTIFVRCEPDRDGYPSDIAAIGVLRINTRNLLMLQRERRFGVTVWTTHVLFMAFRERIGRKEGTDA